MPNVERTLLDVEVGMSLKGQSKGSKDREYDGLHHCVELINERGLKGRVSVLVSEDLLRDSTSC
jgi:hypothetical protein